MIYIQIALILAYIMPIPSIVNYNIDAIVASDVDQKLGSMLIKSIALIFGLLWPLVLLYQIISSIFTHIGIK